MMMLRTLEIVKDGSVVQRVSLSDAECVVGRDEKAAVAMGHGSVSRRHAAFRLEEDKVLVRDLGSTHGTMVDSMKVGEAWVEVREGQSVRFGQSTRSARLGGEEPAFTSFGKAKKQTNDADRKKREEEIAAMTREMTTTKPTWTRRRIDEEDEDDDDWRRAFTLKETSNDDDDDDGGGAQEEKEVIEATEFFETQAMERLEVPATHFVASSREKKTNRTMGESATCIAADPSGARFIVGTAGGVLKMHDFGGMDRRVLPFREVEADAGNRHGVVAVSFAPENGDRFLVCTASSQPQIFAREGTSLLRFTRGDPYVMDPTRTNGHTTTVTGGEWQPREKYRVATSAIDGSVRLWDLCGKTGLRDWLFSETAIRVKDASNRKAAATAMAFAPDGRSIACAANDGSLQLWGLKGRAHAYHRPDAVVREAHARGTDASGAVVSGVVFSPGGDLLASRGDDGYARLWDVRKLSTCLAEFPLLSTDRAQATANLAFSPSGHLLAAGNDDGALLFFDVKQGRSSHSSRPHYDHVLRLGSVVDLPPEAANAGEKKDGASSSLVEKKARRESSLPGVSQIAWHPRLKQILLCDTSGGTKILYSPTTSHKGALLVADRDHARNKKKSPGLDYAHAGSVNEVIINPNALPAYRNDGRLKQTTGYAKMRSDPIKSRKPDPPLEAGQQGRNAGARSTIFQQMIESNLAPSIRNEDPREALLKYAGQPSLFRMDATHYRDKEGKPVMQETTLDEAELEYIDQQKALLRAHPGQQPATKRQKK